MAVASRVIAFDLDEAYTRALKYNADYLAQIAATDAKIEMQNQAFAPLLPQLTATGSYNQSYSTAQSITV